MVELLQGTSMDKAKRFNTWYWVAAILGILLILLFSLSLRLLPAGGYVSPAANFGESLRLMLLPAFALGAGLSAVLMRQIRSAMLEVMSQDYVTTARSKGIDERTVVTPTCGLAGASPAWARRALTVAARVSDAAGRTGEDRDR